MSSDEEIDFSTLDWRRLGAAQKAELRQALIRRAHRMRSEVALALMSAVGGALGRAVKSIGAAFHRINEFYNERVAISSLRKLDDAALRDIGIRRAEIESIVHGQGKDDTRRQRTPDNSATKRCNRSLAA